MVPVIRIDDQVMEELKKRAVNLGLVFESPNTTLRKVLGLDGEVRPNPNSIQSIRQGERTREEAFRRPILSALVQLGGAAKVSDVLEVVERKLASELNAIDYEKVSSGEIRWRNTAEWERKRLVEEGLIKRTSDSRRGIWELSERGVEQGKRIT